MLINALYILSYSDLGALNSNKVSVDMQSLTGWGRSDHSKYVFSYIISVLITQISIH